MFVAAVVVAAAEAAGVVVVVAAAAAVVAGVVAAADAAVAAGVVAADVVAIDAVATAEHGRSLVAVGAAETQAVVTAESQVAGSGAPLVAWAALTTDAAAGLAIVAAFVIASVDVVYAVAYSVFGEIAAAKADSDYWRVILAFDSLDSGVV